MRGLGAKDCLRCLCSKSRNPPAKRRLKTTTPESHATTSQGNTSGEEKSLGEGKTREKFSKALTSPLPMAVGVAATGKTFAVASEPKTTVLELAGRPEVTGRIA